MKNQPAHERRAERQGVDRGQLAALLAASIKLDLRSARSHHGHSRVPPLVIALITYLFMGTLLALAMVGQRDPFVFALFTMSAAMFMTALSVIMEYGTVVVNPDDFEIIAHRPVSSRTYFWAKLGNLLFFVALTGGALTLPGSLIGGLAFGARFGAAYLSMAVAACVAVAAVVVVAYSTALRLWDYERFTSAITYVHTAATVVITLGYVFLPRVLGGDAALVTVERGDWVFVAPPAWFAAAAELAARAGGRQDVVLAAMAVGATVALVVAAANTISLGYSKRLAELASASAARAAHRRPGGAPGRGWLSALARRVCRNDEERVGFELMATYLRRDKKLRARVYPAFGLPLAAYVYGLATGELRGSPPGPGTDGPGILGILGFYCVFVSFFFASSMTQCDHWRASWIFHVAPLRDRSRLLTGARKLIVWGYLVPFFAVLFVLLAIPMTVLDALVFVAGATLLGVTGFAVLSLASAHLPLSRSIEKTRQTRQIVFLLTAGIVAMIATAAVREAASEAPGAAVGLIAALAAAAAAAEALVRRSARRKLAKEEFPG